MRVRIKRKLRKIVALQIRSEGMPREVAKSSAKPCAGDPSDSSHHATAQHRVPGHRSQITASSYLSRERSCARPWWPAASWGPCLRCSFSRSALYVPFWMINSITRFCLLLDINSNLVNDETPRTFCEAKRDQKTKSFVKTTWSYIFETQSVLCWIEIGCL